MRIRLIFEKTESMRYTGHLDLYRTLERTIRRANLPLGYSKGYTPRPKISIASPLPHGFISEYEMVDIWLDEVSPLDEIKGRILKASPPGVKVRTLEEVGLNSPKPQNMLESAEYEAVFLNPVADLGILVKNLLSSEVLSRERRGKPYNLRPLVLNLKEISPDTDGRQRLWLHLLAQEGATGRPDEVVREMGVNPFSVRFKRVKLHFSDMA